MTAHSVSCRLAILGAVGVAVSAVAVAVSAPAGAIAPERASAMSAIRPLERPAPRAAHPAERATDQVIVRMKTSTDGTTVAAVGAARKAGLTAISARTLRVAQRSSTVVKLDHPMQGDELQQTLAAIAAQPGVASVSPDRIKRPLAFPVTNPNDTYYSSQWSLLAPTVGNYGADVAPIWRVTTGTNLVTPANKITVAVIDTGYVNHSDQSANLVNGYDFVTDTAMANDGNGRDADAHDPGDWMTDAVIQSNLEAFQGCLLQDSSFHGTHVAGIIGAKANNTKGVVGIAPGVQLVIARALGRCGGYDSDIIDAMLWSGGQAVSGVPANANPAKIINLSLGGAGSCTTEYQTAINTLIAAGVVVVTAAGNEDTDAKDDSPGNCNNVINVAATNKAGNRASYSNYDIAESHVTVSAPGGDIGAGEAILSTLNNGATSPSTEGYSSEAGTSMAAPAVSATIALMMSVKPELTPAQVKTLITNPANLTAFPGGSTCNTSKCGAGIIDAYKLVVAAGNLSVPAAPSALNAQRGPTKVDLTWTPGANGNLALSDYLVERSTNGTTWTTVTHAPFTSAAYSVTGLTNGTSYQFRVSAINALGTGTASGTASATPAALPGAARLLSSWRGDLGNQAMLAWSPPVSSGGGTLSDYKIQQSTNGTTWLDVSHSASTSTAYTVTGLTNGTSYKFRVAAITDVGVGPWSNVSVIVPLAYPAAPSSLSATAGNKSAVLNWPASANNGGAPVLRYVVQRSIDNTTWVSAGVAPGLTTKVQNLTNGTTYFFRVAAVTTRGQGSWSSTASAKPLTVPGKPTGVTAVAGDGVVTLNWVAPASNGGDAITGYKVERLIGSTWTLIDTAAFDATSYLVFPLPGGITYKFRLKATNGAGDSLTSNVVSAKPNNLPN